MFKSKEFVAVDLFCGIGGLTKGLSMAGINVVAGFDIDDTCKYAYEHNNSAKFYLNDVSKLSGKDIMRLYPKNAIRILVGCAPCQPFSKYSHKHWNMTCRDSKWNLLTSFSSLINEIKPHVISMENVPGLSKENVFRDFLNNLNYRGFFTSWNIIHCPQYGVPQKRNRLVLLASRLGEIKIIPPIYLDKKLFPTVRMAIENLPALKAGEVDKNDYLHRACRLSITNLKRIRQSVPGGTWRDWNDDLKLKCHLKDGGKTYPSVYGRMKWDEPAPTITTQFYGYGNGRFGHPEQDRAISFREGALLQSFPIDYVFFDKDTCVNYRELGIHIGNAVPVELGKAIGMSILKHLEGYV